MSIFEIDCLLQSSRDEDVALLVNGTFVLELLLRAREAEDGLLILLVLVELLKVDPVRVVDAAVSLSHADDFRPVFRHVLAREIPDVTEPLHDD